MDKDTREKLIAYHDALCAKYNETEDESLLEIITLAELALCYDAPFSKDLLDLEKEI